MEGLQLVEKTLSVKSKCWITEGFGCPYFINDKFFDTYKCIFKESDSPCNQ